MSELLAASLTVLKNYGVFGFLILAIVFCGAWFVHRVISHFISEINKFHLILESRDEQVFKMAKEFSGAVRDLTQTIDRDLAIKVDLSKAHDNVVKSFDRMSRENKKEHDKILEHFNGFEKRFCHG